MASGQPRARAAACKICGALVAPGSATGHEDYHSRLYELTNGLGDRLGSYHNRLLTAERQTLQAMERISRLEAQLAWSPASDQQEAEQECSWACPGCGKGDLELVLGGRRPGLRCGRCRRPVSSG